MKNLQICVILAALSLCQFGHSQSQPIIQVLQATYGADSAQMDVTEKVQSLVQSGQTDVRVGNHLFGKDPIFGKTKTLSVSYSSNGVQYRADIREGQPFLLSTSTVDQRTSQTQATEPAVAAGPSASPIATPTVVRPEDSMPGVTLWLVQRISVKTSTGVIGILPGSKVTVTKDNGPTVTVTDGTHTFEAQRTQLATDSALAEEAATADYDSQVAMSKARDESHRKLTDEKSKYWAKEQSALDQRDKIRALESRYAALQEQESELLRQIGEAEEPLTTVYGRHKRNPASSDLSSLRASLNDVRRAKDGVKRQMEAAQRSY